MAFGKIFLSLASSGCQPDGFLIVLKGSSEHRRSLSLQKQLNLVNSESLKLPDAGWIERKVSASTQALSVSSLLLHSCFSKCLSAEWEHVFFCVPCLSGLRGKECSEGETEGRERDWLKHEDIHLDKSFITPQTAPCKCYAEKWH